MRFFLLLALCCPLVASAQSGDQLLTQSTDFARVKATAWRAEGWRVENPDPGATIVEVDGVLAFVVTEAHRSMAWTLTTEPFWVDPFGTLAASYFVEGGIPEGNGSPFTLFDGSTGPITPGATNAENPLASGGRLECGTFTEGLHLETIDLTGVENLDRVAEITITVRSGEEPVVLRLNQLAFMARPADAITTAMPIQVATSENTMAFEALSLPKSNRVPRASAATMLGIAPGTLDGAPILFDSLPFTLDAFAVATPLDDRGNITVSAAGTGNTLAFLCGARLWGSGEGWYSSNFVPIRWKAPHAHQFVATLTYEDGTVHQAIPSRQDDKGPGLWPGLNAYVVSVDPNRELSQVTLSEGMSYGQLVLLAASRLDLAPPAPVAEALEEVAVTGAAREVPEDDLLIEGEILRMAMDRQGLVHSIQLGTERREIVDEPFPLVTLIDPEGNATPLRLVEVLEVPTGDHLVCLWAVGEDGRQCELSLKIRKDGGLECAATLSNRSEEPWSLIGVLPRLTGLQVSADQKPAYVLGGRSAIMDNAPIDTAEVYGGLYPNQFMDVYDEASGGGLAYMVLDDTLARKWFEFKQDDTGATNMAVSYRNLKIAPGERRSLPPVVLLPHEGDWRAPFQVYREWVQRTFPRTRPNKLDDVFYCRRDYPLGGTTYLFDTEKQGYSFEKILSESQWAFGGTDMVDISGWAFNESLGRVGTYTTNDLGGLDALAKGVWLSHTRRAKVGLYFEGYLLDKRAARGEEGLAEWQLIRADDKPAWWSGGMEFFCCPGATGWQEALAADIAAVAEKTKADAVYVDQLGICGTDKECWSPKHGHEVPSNPIKTEIALLQRIREALDKVQPECAIYIEHIPCDAMAPYIDGAFNLGMKHTKSPMGPTKLPLHRYVHPEIPVFEMVAHGIRPIPAEEDDLKLAFFHGMGLWLKGRGASWYSDGFRQRAADFYPIYKKFGDYFRSPDAEPHVDTLADGVYANRFPHDGNVLYTLYNANPTTISGPLLSLPAEDGLTITSLVDGVALTLESDDGSMHLVGSIPPEGVAGVVVQRKQ